LKLGQILMSAKNLLILQRKL